jgi:hypothetical protein
MVESTGERLPVQGIAAAIILRIERRYLTINGEQEGTSEVVASNNRDC